MYRTKKSTISQLPIRGINLNFVLLFLLLACFISCQSKSKKTDTLNQTSINEIDQVYILSDSVLATKEASQKSIDNYKSAKHYYLKNTNDAEALIWFGRRTAYLGEFEKAIDIYSNGIRKHPKDARLYRHRGHRYISIRKYEHAIEDFEVAAQLIENQKDQVEPDGLPNERNIPLSTLHGNIWYHLGLAYYLKNDLDNALTAFSNRTVTEKYPDNLVSGGHWQYMILRRMGNEKEANAAIEKVTADMDIIENMSYHKMCLFYKGLITEEDLQPKGDNSSSNDVLTYGLGNWYLYDKQDTVKAKELFKQLLDNGNKYSFAYIAAESDWKRMAW